jgi:hypothetical protein
VSQRLLSNCETKFRLQHFRGRPHEDGFTMCETRVGVYVKEQTISLIIFIFITCSSHKLWIY